MLKFLFSVLLTLSLAAGAVANPPIIAIYDFETPERTPIHARNKWHIEKDMYGNAAVIDSKEWGFSKIKSTPRVIDHTISFVAWIALGFKDEGSFHFFFQRGDRHAMMTERVLEVKSDGALRFTASTRGDPFEIISEPQETLLGHHWHHIAYTYFLGVHKLFVDGEVVFDLKAANPKILGTLTFIAIGDIYGEFIGRAHIDDVGIFGSGLSDEEVRAIYNQPLSEYLNILPVDPQGKASTTWAALKSD